MTEREKLLERIKKVERLAADNPSGGEAMAARECAERLRKKLSELPEEGKAQSSPAFSPVDFFRARYRVCEITDADLDFYMNALKTIARQNIFPPGLIVWNTKTEIEKFLFFKRLRHSLYVSFESESKDSLDKMEKTFFALTGLVPCQ